MSRGRILTVLAVGGGYVAAVLVAVVVTVALVLAPTALPDDGANGSIFRMMRDLTAILLVGMVWTFVCAFPGFVAAIVAGERSSWERWHFYALAGLANVVPSFVVFAILFGSPFDMPHVLAASFPGGFAGGAAYWYTAGRFVARRRYLAGPDAA